MFGKKNEANQANTKVKKDGIGSAVGISLGEEKIEGSFFQRMLAAQHRTARNVTAFVMMFLCIVCQLMSYFIAYNNFLYEYSWSGTLADVMYYVAFAFAAVSIILCVIEIVLDIKRGKNKTESDVEYKGRVSTDVSVLLIVATCMTLLFNILNTNVGIPYETLTSMLSLPLLVIYNLSGVLLVLMTISIVPWVYFQFRIQDDIPVID